MRKILSVILLSAVFVFCSFAEIGGDDTNGDGKDDRWIVSEGGIITEVRIDRDYDGRVDYLTIYDENFKKIEERLDYNFDGEMDDFYFYKADSMYRREIDTNFDGKVDIWVYLDGVYIEKYEKDTDFDGKVDLTEDYTED